MRSLLVSVVLVALAVGLAACGSDDDDAAETTTDGAAAAKVFVEPKGSISVENGQDFNLVYEYSPGVGESLRLAEPVDPEFLEFRGTKALGAVNEGTVGGDVRYQYSFRALRPGTTEIVFQTGYRGDWKRPEPPLAVTIGG